MIARVMPSGRVRALIGQSPQCCRWSPTGLHHIWDHLETVIRIRKETHEIETGKLLEQEDHYAISSLPIDALSADQWLHAFRAHWGVENQCHHTWDTAFSEDDKPWIETDPKGIFVVLLLRRLAYNLLALYRSVTQRSDERRQTPWKTLLRWVYNTLIKAQADDISGLRTRKANPLCHMT